MNTTHRAIKSIRNYLENDLGLENYEAFLVANSTKHFYLKEMTKEAHTSIDEDDTDPIGSEEEADGEEEQEDTVLKPELPSDEAIAGLIDEEDQKAPQEKKGGKVLADGKETPEGPEDFLDDKEDDKDPLDDEDWDDDEDEEEKPKKKKK